MMNAINPSDYFKRKADVNNLSNAITDKQAEINDLSRRINKTQTHVNEINAKLAIEERAMKVPGPLSKATLTYDQYVEQKRIVNEMEAELPVLNESMAMLNTALTMLQNDFGNKSREFQGIREQTANALANQVAKQVVELAGLPIENLIDTLVVAGGKFTDNSFPTQELFLKKLSIKIRDALSKGQAEEKPWLPSLQNANQHFEGLLHEMYLAEQTE
ncbi:MAG: hypothetical protein ACXV8Q_04185 [Methylobacter sp.]